MRGHILGGISLISFMTLVGLGLAACSVSVDSGSDASDGESGATASASESGLETSASGTTGASGDTASASDGGTTSGPGSTGTSGASTGTGGTAGDTDGTGGQTTDSGTSATSGDSDTGTDTDTDTDTSTSGGDLCDAESPVVLYLSPDDSNSMSSPVQVRASALSYKTLAGIPLRAWEFFNYYTFAYPPAPKGEVVIASELFRLEDAPEGEYLLQIGVSSELISDADRAPMNITLVLDESGSMTGTPMSLLKESCRAIAASLKQGDIVSMVGWDTENAIKLAGYKVTGPNDAMLLTKIEELAAGGGTDLNGGLVAGYDLAHKSYDPSRINRVVLISDGGANAGETEASVIAEGAGSNDMDGIYMVGVGVGNGNTYNDYLMDTVTDIGKGASVFIPDEAEAWKIFNADFVNTMAVAARDVQVQLDMPPGFEIVTFSGEEFSADPSEIEPQHLAPNDTMVFHQTIATCAPELISDDSVITVTARYKDGITFEEREVVKTVTFGELLGIQSPLVRKGAAVFAYTEALKAIRDLASDKQGKLDDFNARLTDALTLLPGDAELLEMSSVIDVL